MRELSRLTKETIHLGALDEDSIVYIHKIDSMYNLRMYSRIGRRNPLYSTAIGKVLLARRDRDEVKQILDGVEYKQSTDARLPALKRCCRCWMKCVRKDTVKITKNRKKDYVVSAYRYLTVLA